MTTTDLSDGQPARILIFDQCPLFARALSELIGEQVPGSVRRITHNANDALEEARNEHPDLVFIDLDGGDIGVTLLKDIKLLENAPRCVPTRAAQSSMWSWATRSGSVMAVRFIT